jgi:hypothetical protein
MISCSIDSWLQTTLTGYGLRGLFVGAFFVLLFWGNKTHRREHWINKKISYGAAAILNAPSIFMFVCSLAFLGASIFFQR